MNIKELSSNLLCPDCGNDNAPYIQITKVIIDQGYQITTYTGAGAISEPSKTKRKRGSEIRIEFICRMGHRWRLDFTSHKERTVANLEVLVRHMPWLSTPWRNLPSYEPL